MGELQPDSNRSDRFSGWGICEMLCIQPEINRRRFYRIEVLQGLFSPMVIRSWGRIGCRIRVKVYFHEDMLSAVANANKLYLRKIKRGYQESSIDGVVAVHPTQIQNLTISRKRAIPNNEPMLPFC